MTDPADIERIMRQFVGRLDTMDRSQRAMLPSRRTIEATCSDLGLTYHAFWRDGALSDLNLGPILRPNIRILVVSSVLVDLASGSLRFSDAWLRGQVQLEASMTDMFRLRAAM